MHLAVSVFAYRTIYTL